MNRPWSRLGCRLTRTLMVLVCWPIFAGSTAPLPDFTTIEFWSGAGTNRAALTIQWNDGGNPTSLLWGYRWNGPATGLDMIRALAGSSTIRDTGGVLVAEQAGGDPRLATVWTRYSFGDALDAVMWSSGGILRNRTDWSAGYWQYSIFGGQLEYDLYDEYGSVSGTGTYERPGSTVYPENEWFASPVGAGARPLVDGAWDSWNFAANFTAPPLVNPVPASAPTVVAPPRVLTTRISAPGWLEVVFATQIGISYQLKKSAVLSPAPNWQNSGPVFEATQTLTTLTLPIQQPEGREFFRLETVP